MPVNPGLQKTFVLTCCWLSIPSLPHGVLMDNIIQMAKYSRVAGSHMYSNTTKNRLYQSNAIDQQLLRL